MKRRIFVTTGIAGSATAMAAPTFGAEDTIEKNKELARRFTDELWCARKLEVADEILSPDFVNHNPFPDTESDRGGEKKAVTIHSGIMADPESVIHDQIAEGDKVATRWTFRATHQGKFLGVEATGKRVTVTGINICRMKDGKIVELWREVDAMGLYQQLRAPETKPA